MIPVFFCLLSFQIFGQVESTNIIHKTNVECDIDQLEKERSSIPLECERFKVKHYDYYIKSDHKFDVIHIVHVLDICGEKIDVCENSKSIVKAEIQFVSDLIKLEQPQIHEGSDGESFVRVFYHFKDKDDIMEILQCSDVTFNYKKWNENNSWASLSFYSNMPKE